ncbi:MAG: lysophospholipase, partial [Bacteroidota bacterium]
MLHTTSTFKTADGLTLYHELRKPSNEPKAVIHFVHGMFEHTGRFTPTMEYLVKQGFAVCAYDQRGHGKSEGRRGDTPSYGHLIADLETFFNIGKEAYPDHKHFLFGHSMGGALVVNFALRKKPKIAGIIPSAPWFRIAMDVESWKQRFVHLLVKFWPTYTEQNQVSLSLLTRDKNEIEQYKTDSLMHTKITARFFMEATASGEWAI